jgi:ABC-type glutathione transport system ATPase component
MPSTLVSTETPAAGAAPALQLRGVSVALRTRGGYLSAVHELSVGVRAGECLGVVGESGAGKSQAFLAALGLAPPHARVSGTIELEGRAIAASDVRSLRALRGARIAMVFQDPMSSLTPHLRVGDQIAEVLVRHRSHSWRAARERAQALLERVHVPEAGRRVRQYPHELSGGMRQRVMLALALACDPAVLIADEPTTSLDVTIQAQILGVLQELKRTGALALVLISHDLGVIAGMADRIAVMHGGRLIEQGSAEEIFRAPQHPRRSSCCATRVRGCRSVREARDRAPRRRSFASRGCVCSSRCLRAPGRRAHSSGLSRM